MAPANRLGIDIGRVIIGGGAPGDEDTAFFDGGLEEAMRTPAIDGAFEAVARLVDRFEGQVWLVSKCGERVQRRTTAWLDHHDFHGRTGLDRTQVRFCRRRAEKADHCRELGLTDFVDDRVDVLGFLRGVVEDLVLFGPQDEPTPDWVTWAVDWPTAEAHLVARLGGPA